MNQNYNIVFLFSGQGSHYRGMGKRLYQGYPRFAKSLRQSDALIQQHIGQSIIEELYEKKNKKFDDLLLTHPAIVAIELAMLDLMEEFGIQADYVSGNSLGEFAAGVAAGIWTKDMALEAAIEQAKSIIQESKEGGMLTIINETPHRLKSLLDKNNLYIASNNFPQHFTISGKTKDLNIFQQALKHLNIPCFRLPVNYPFHSPLIESGRRNFSYYTSTALTFSKPSKRFISGLYYKELQALPKDYFWKVICQQTNFTSFVHYMETKGTCLYLDLGPSGTSANFVKYNLSVQSKSVVLPMMTPFIQEEKQLKYLKTLLYKDSVMKRVGVKRKNYDSTM